MKVYARVPCYGYQKDEEIEVYNISQPKWMENHLINTIYFLIWQKDTYAWCWAPSWCFKPSPSWEE